MFSEKKQFKFQSEKAARLAAHALAQELEGRFFGRSQTSIHINKNLVLLTIVAKDRHSLDAAMNSFSRLLEMCREIALLGG